MSKARNTVISGLYTDGVLSISNFYRTIDNHVVKINYLKITTINSKDYKVDFAVINEQSIQSVEIINREGILTDYGSSIARGVAGGLLLGDAGLIAGAGMGKQSSINMLQITWKDGQKSLVEVDSIILSKLNIICWNIQNNIEGEQLTKEEILAQIEENKKKSEIETEKARNIYLKILYCVSILIFLSGIMCLFGSTEEQFCALGNIFIGIVLFPPVRAKTNAYFLPKFKNRNILYGIVKFFVVMCIADTFMLFPVINTTTNNTSTTQKIEQEVKKETPTPAPKPKISKKPVNSENDYFSVANTLENYYKNYFNSDNWYVNSVIPADKTIHVSMIVVDPIWQENIKKYSSSRQYMVNCACPNSYTDVWHKIHKSDVSVTIYDVYGKRIGGGICTN